MGNKVLDETLVQRVAERFSQAVQVEGEGFQLALVVAPEKALELFRFLRDDPAYQMDFLGNETAVEYPEYFEVVYHIYSIPLLHSITVKVRTGKENPEVPSAVGIWPTADFQEREIYDLMGVSFSGHPNMTRILLPREFEGHPLRKDYKLPPRPPGY